MSSPLSRRALLAGAVAVVAAPSAIRAEALPSMIVHHDPGCGCCKAWVAHVRAAGVVATIVDEPDLAPVKARLGVPPALESCHTAEIGGYVVEGHVPAAAVLRLLREKPDAIGLAAPGMPAGSPGMEGAGPPEPFEVVLFGPAGVRLYGRYRGEEAA